MGDSTIRKRHRPWQTATAAAAGALITLHQPGGVEIYVNGDEIMLVAPANEKSGAPPRVKSAVTVHDKTIFVVETPAEVKRLRDGE